MLGFIIALAAGYITPQLEGPVVGPIKKVLAGRFPIEAHETRLIAFMVAVLGAGLIASLLDTGSPFVITVGVILGYFGTRIVNLVKARGKASEN